MGQSWLVLELTDSSFLVGLVNAMPAMALLVLSPIGGVIADRYDRRLVALYGRLVVAIMSYFVAFLVEQFGCAGASRFSPRCNMLQQRADMPAALRQGIGRRF